MDQYTLDFEQSHQLVPPVPKGRVRPRRKAKAAAASPAVAPVPVAVQRVAAEVSQEAVQPELGEQEVSLLAYVTAPSVAGIGSLPGTIAEVMARLRTLDGLSERRRRDVLSALRKVCKIAGKTAEEIPATATSLRAIFANTSPAAARVSRRRWNNLRCLALDAIRRAGLPALTNRAHQPLSLTWDALRDRLPDVTFRAGLSRFMGWCSANAIDPESVTLLAFDRFAEALREGTIRLDPKQAFRTTCILWNRAAAEIDGWPALVVEVPSHSRRYALDWEAFPESFRADVEAFLTCKQTEDPFAENYVKSVKSSTTAMRRKQIRQMATALASSGMDVAAITGLAALVTPDGAERLLKVFYGRHEGSSVYLYQQATLLKTLARHWVKAPAAAVYRVAELAKNLAVKRSFMTDKNRELLRQFDNPANLRALLQLPWTVISEVQKKGKGKRADALRVMLAVAVELLLTRHTNR
jgi:PAS domain-containing protein